jgi:Protein of unknown function (DUF3631)
MKRRLKSELVERLNHRNLESVEQQANVLAGKVTRWAADNKALLLTKAPEVPAALVDNDRAVDNWDLLLGIAQLAGPRWAKAAADAAVTISATTSGEDADMDLGIKLLEDIRELIQTGTLTGPVLASTPLTEALKKHGGPESVWASMPPKGRQLTTRRLALMLRRFELIPTSTAACNGYKESELIDVFSRYLQKQRVESSKLPQTLGAVGQNGDQEVPSSGASEQPENPTAPTTCGTLELQTGEPGNDAGKKVSDRRADELRAQAERMRLGIEGGLKARAGHAPQTKARLEEPVEIKSPGQSNALSRAGQETAKRAGQNGSGGSGDTTTPDADEEVEV